MDHIYYIYIVSTSVIVITCVSKDILQKLTQISTYIYIYVYILQIDITPSSIYIPSLQYILYSTPLHLLIRINLCCTYAAGATSIPLSSSSSSSSPSTRKPRNLVQDGLIIGLASLGRAGSVMLLQHKTTIVASLVSME